MSGKIFIGTSGWSYKDWKNKFYPKSLKNSAWLNFYADHFNTVEVNNSFYQLPSKKSLKKWLKKVPSDFVFSVKASRYITHLKKLKNPKNSLKRFLKRMEYLNAKKGPILFQLPPNWHVDAKRLENFIKLLLNQTKDQDYVFEFRNKAWLKENIRSILRKFNIGFCINDMVDENIDWITSNFVYIRFHGPSGNYKNSYNSDFLKEWAEKVKDWKSNLDQVFIYFNNDIKAHAIKNAKQFQQYLNK